MTEKKIATPEEWSKRGYQARIIELPSGLCVRARKIHLYEAISIGHIQLPMVDEMMTTFARAMEPDKDGSLKVRTEAFKEKDIGTMFEVFRRFASVAVVEPRAALPDESGAVPEGVMNVLEIPLEDLAEIFAQCLHKGAAEYAPFPGDKQAGGNDGSAGEKVRSASKRSARNR